MRKWAVVAGLMAFVVLTAYGVYVVVRDFGTVPLHLPTAHPCLVGTDPDDRVALSAEQMANAATISAVGIRRGVPRRGIVVALATAWQESKLVNLSGGDRDSLGLFQQRPSQGWGTAEQVSDPRYAAGAFYKKLLKVRGWQKMRVTDAAQTVQRSAHPDAYEQWAAKSEVLAIALTGEATGAVGCTVSGDPPQRGGAAAQALVDGLRLDWGDVKSTLQPAGVMVTVRSEQAGWQYSHWLVAHAADRGVRRVRFGAQEWSAQSGKWIGTTTSAPPAGSGNAVHADVHG